MKISVLICLMSFLVACSTGPVKAPCDYQAHYCGSKMKINAW